MSAWHQHGCVTSAAGHPVHRVCPLQVRVSFSQGAIGLKSTTFPCALSSAIGTSTLHRQKMRLCSPAGRRGVKWRKSPRNPANCTPLSIRRSVRPPSGRPTPAHQTQRAECSIVHAGERLPSPAGCPASSAKDPSKRSGHADTCNASSTFRQQFGVRLVVRCPMSACFCAQPLRPRAELFPGSPDGSCT